MSRSLRRTLTEFVKLARTCNKFLPASRRSVLLFRILYQLQQLYGKSSRHWHNPDTITNSTQNALTSLGHICLFHLRLYDIQVLRHEAEYNVLDYDANTKPWEQWAD
jgi:hypothetical protein